MEPARLIDTDVEEKKVLVRGDFDVNDLHNPRADSIRNIVRFLVEKKVGKVKVIGHRETDFDLSSELKSEFPNVEFDSGLRDDPGEKANSIDFARKLADGWDVYVNEAFATSHRQHASIVSLPKVIKEGGGEAVLGLRFEQEIENLNRVLDNPKRPLVMVVSGLKEDKLLYIEDFAKIADKILIAGRLPEYIGESSRFEVFGSKLVIARLLPDKEDITINSMEKFEREIATAETIVVSGPIGKFEDFGHRQGTDRVFKAVTDNRQAFKVAGGGDTQQAFQLLGLTAKIDWMSVGGGAMLEFLAKKTLPAIESLK